MGVIPLLLMVLLACQRTLPPENEDTMSPNTDITALDTYIQLPYLPQQAFWQTYEKGVRGSELGPTDWELVAVLEYDEATLKTIQAEMTTQTHPAESFVHQDMVRDWFPEPIKSRFVQDPAYAETFKLTGVRYTPSMFAQSPLSDGYVFIVDNLVFIYLHTM